MKKKLVFAIAIGFFAVATVFNMNLLQGNGVSDVSLDDIAVMAQAQNGENNSKGAKSILITDLGSNNPCVGGIVYNCTVFDVVCLGDGGLPCTAGTFVSCTPTQTKCANV
jgi:hypothetical protein